MSPADLDPEFAALLAAAAIAPADVAECAPLSGGTYNSLLRVVLQDGRRYVLKRPPAADRGSTLRYEHDLLRGETEYCRAARDLRGVPVPRLIHVESDADRSVVTGLVMTECPGVPWHQADASLEPANVRGCVRGWAGSSLGCTPRRARSSAILPGPSARRPPTGPVPSPP